MSNALLQIWSVLSLIWSTFFTGWRIPLLNFTPATLIFGVLSFFVAIKFMVGILNITTNGLSNNFERESRTKEYQSWHQHNKNGGH